MEQKSGKIRHGSQKNGPKYHFLTETFGVLEFIAYFCKL